MSVICEECGKIYHIDPQKLSEKIGDGKKAKFRCRVCDQMIIISMADASADPEEGAPAPIQEHRFAPVTPPPPSNESAFPTSDTANSTESPEQDLTPPSSAPTTAKMSAQSKSGGSIGLRGKMFFLFLVIPLSLMAASGIFTQKQMDRLAADLTEQSAEVVRKLAIETFAERARTVAAQCRIFLASHPDLNREDFNYDIEFKHIAVQKLGDKGFTILLQRPSQEQNWIIWAHPDARVVGIADLSMQKRLMGDNFDEFYKVINQSKGGKREAMGYFTELNSDGRRDNLFMAITPIEFTPYMIASVAYLEDFVGKVQTLEADAARRTRTTLNINLMIIIGSLIIIGLSITIYGYRLTQNIKRLTDAADRISVGELDTVIEIRSTDEIGKLAESISRMQDSLRLSIERLRRRR
ncbi:MAG: hypothetical protein CSA22_01555 [Deltaproteobacteria bacterium]|nr:MAG: hypothetical protein CSA22_01555 [Deltaproteobacteria bacterium]